MSTISRIPFVGGSRAAHALLVLAASMGAVCSVRGALVPKADNLDPLSAGSSWLGGIAPGGSDVALFDGAFQQVGPLSLGASVAWAGLSVGSPAADLVFAPGSTLGLGSAGLDLSSATRSLTIQGPLSLAATQTWVLPSGAQATVGGLFERADGVTLNINLSEGAALGLSSVTPASLLLASSSPYATVNGRDFAAVDANGQLVPGAQVLAYVPNPAADLPSMAGTISGVVDVINSGSYGIRLGNSLTVTNGIRFSSPHATLERWLIDAPSGRTLTVGSILVSPELGSDRVLMSGSGFLRGSNNQAAGGLVIHQHNPAGEFEVALPIANFSGYFTPLTKTGPGALVLSGNSGYTGPTYVWDGDLVVRGNNASCSGAVTVHPPARLSGTGVVGGPTTIRPGAVLASDSLIFTRGLTLQGDTVLEIDGTATAGTDYDTVIVDASASLALGGRLALSVNQVLAPGDYALRLFDYAGTPGGSFTTVLIGGAYQLELVNVNGVWTGATGGVTFSFSQSTGELSINVPVTQTNGTLILISEHRPSSAEPGSPGVPAAASVAARSSVQS